MGDQLDEATREYVLAVGGISLVWAHQELALDILIGLCGHIIEPDSKRRHPVSVSQKLKRLTDILLAKHPRLTDYSGELLQIISMTDTAASRRNVIAHGALFSTLTGAEVELSKLTRTETDDEIEQEKTSIHEMFVVFRMMVELMLHSYNLLIRIVQEQLPEQAGELADVKLLDVSGFDWPAVNPSYRPPAEPSD